MWIYSLIRSYPVYLTILPTRAVLITVDSCVWLAYRDCQLVVVAGFLGGFSADIP
ncbi:MAG: hypothetical protein ACXACU_18260 [Candidatus Hodarchaeales archaeon]